jgi:uncharacterized protein (DUF427 family)
MVNVVRGDGETTRGGAWQHVDPPAQAAAVRDILAPRHFFVRQDDRVVADTHAPLVLYESGFAPRWYVSRPDIAAEALHVVDGQRFCPYKGLASYYDIGDARNAAWSYRSPFEEVAPIADLVSFNPEKLAITIDGEKLEPAPGQNVISHGPDRNLSVDEIGDIQLLEEAAAAEA